MAGHEAAVFTNMCMITDHAGRVLVQKRSDPKTPGITFPGGHVERGEAFATSVIREVWEETGLLIEQPKLCGVKQFQTEAGARYVVFLYRADRFSGTLTSSAEGDVFWVEREKLLSYPLTFHLEDMLCVFESDETSELCYESKDNTRQAYYY